MIYLSEELKAFIEVNQFDTLQMLQLFAESTSPNSNPVSLWHGMDDIINRKIPRFLVDNMNENQLQQIRDLGWKDNES